jgi:hypothetical protein
MKIEQKHTSMTKQKAVSTVRYFAEHVDNGFIQLNIWENQGKISEILERVDLKS